MDEKKLKVLKAVRDQNKPSYEALGEVISVSKSSISQYYIQPLEDKGLIEVNRDSNPHIVTITKDGLDKIIEENEGTGSPHRVNREEGDEDNYFVHNFVLGFPVQNSEMLNDSWRERLLEYHDIEYEAFEEFNHVVGEVNKWRFRLTEDEVLVRSKEEIRGKSVQGVKEEILEFCKRGAEFLQEDAPIVLDDSPASYRVVSQHIGSIGRNLGQAFVKYIDEQTEHNPSHFRVLDDEGELRVWCDKSSGEIQFESGNGGNPSGKRETAESTQAFFEEVSAFMDQNRGQTREALYNVPSKVQALEKQGEKLKSTTDKQGEALSDVREVVSEIRESRKAEKDTREALIELVRSNKQEREEMEERYEERMDRMQESFRTQLERQQEIIEDLHEEVKELREKDKSLERRVRERFEKASGFSTVHEHSNPGNNSLYVWDNTGDSQEYRKVLDESMRDRPKVQISHGSQESGGVVHG